MVGMIWEWVWYGYGKDFHSHIPISFPYLCFGVVRSPRMFLNLCNLFSIFLCIVRLKKVEFVAGVEKAYERSNLSQKGNTVMGSYVIFLRAVGSGRV